MRSPSWPAPSQAGHRAVAELMGHTQLQTTVRYAHLAPGHLAQAVECLTVPHAEAVAKKQAEAR